ncbi:aspartyl aminopeptidase [Clostridium sp. USBA 49]|jgi:aspartyl aminopeptidase|uniref:M18 family aminopeptidase n=1 Tax=Clostridium sp. USBA 49 TaxID=1881060 RepID=UPI00099AAD1B|nr:M18 family aminopeptidase [Clostridium sp. USBA 49]SKA73505.1 aspartyl aminopeptidase [Clostridium sp. USBA 49]
MTNEIKFAQNLIDFIYESPTAFHAVESVKKVLLDNGFKELKEEERWKFEKNGKYFVTKNDSALFAFILGSGSITKKGFRIIGAHTDSPSFRIKPNPEIISENAYIKLNTEVYGGPILNTWFDRPLSIAGRVIVKGENIFYPKTKLVNINKPILIIPNLAIHMNKDVNKGMEINTQKDTLPLVSVINNELEKENYLLNIIASELKINVEDILDFDIFLYEYEKGKIIGPNDEFISSSRLDDLAMVHAALYALVNTKESQNFNVLACFDNEEVGSSTKQGANSEILANILERIVLNLGGDREDFFRTIARSFMISSDLAHAVHPNAGEKADPINRPIINKGPVIKLAANQSYTTDADSLAVYEQICKKAEVPVQKFVNRSDARGGSTIGPISSTHINLRCVDMGTPILAMHSIRELGGVLDHTYVSKSFEEFYKL